MSNSNVVRCGRCNRAFDLSKEKVIEIAGVKLHPACAKVAERLLSIDASLHGESLRKMLRLEHKQLMRQTSVAGLIKSGHLPHEDYAAFEQSKAEQRIKDEERKAAWKAKVAARVERSKPALSLEQLESIVRGE